MLKRITVALGLLLAPVAALAQSSVLPFYYNIAGQKVPVGTSNPLPVSASISASVSPFVPSAAGARGTPITVTTSDTSGNLPTNTGAVVVANVGANPMYCNVNAIAATTSDQYISASGGWFNFGIPAAVTTLRCIATGGSTTANMLGGSGLASGTGGGSGGGGGGGAVTIASGAVASGAYSSGSIASGAYASGSIGSGAVASGAIASGAFASGSVAAGAFATGSLVDGAYLTDGAIADAAVTAGATGSNSAKLRAISRDIGTIATLAATPLPAQTTNSVNIGAVMNAGNKANTIAASATNFVLSSTQGGGTGTTGDYLSHCVIQPGTTSPGAFTILDNATTIYSFPGGASSVSNLVSFAIPIGAVSGSGGWKITTTTNITGTCFGKFT